MTHRERIVAALSHEQPDLVPIDLGGTVNSSIVLEGYEKLKQHFGIKAESKIVVSFFIAVTFLLEFDERKSFCALFNCISAAYKIHAIEGTAIS